MQRESLVQGELTNAHGLRRMLTDQRQLLRVQKQMAAVKLLIIDELDFVPLSKTGAELLFEMISRRYERGATLITSNLPFEEWTETFGTEPLPPRSVDPQRQHS
jgi:DNA replication protein DnaC